MEGDPTGAFRALEEFKAKQVEKSTGLQRKLEGISPVQQEFPKEEMQQIIECRLLMKEVERKMIKLGTDQPEKIFENLAKIQKIIDSLKIWDTKFTTGNENEFKRTDSVYYTTPSGIALRFKMANIETDPQHVIQPFMESITFEDFSKPDPHEYPEEMPAAGLHPQEWLSQEFYDFQNGSVPNAGFVSQVRNYFKDQKLFYVQKPDHIYHEHNGTPVNKVIFIR